jgi:dTDP-glucose 4,6-dehydratase
MKLLVCGGAGFIASNFIHSILESYPHYEVVNYDKLTYAGNLDNLKDIESNLQFSTRYTFIRGDICDEKLLSEVVEKYKITHIINFAAETHVDRSIHGDCNEFVMTNTFGVLSLLNIVKKYGIEKFINVSTDEVYGSLDFDTSRLFTEETPIEPNMPYAAAKAGGDLMCRAYYVTKHVPVIVTHCSNNYGPFQYPEKLIPISVFRILKNKPVSIHGTGKNIRDWIFVRDHCSALALLLHQGVAGEVYNIGSDNERSNLEIVQTILRLMNKSRDLIEFVEDRPGNDLRYGIDASKIRNLGWKPVYTRDRFEIGLSETINWYLTHRDWVVKLWKRHDEAYDINNTPTRVKKQILHDETVYESATVSSHHPETLSEMKS